MAACVRCAVRARGARGGREPRGSALSVLAFCFRSTRSASPSWASACLLRVCMCARYVTLLDQAHVNETRMKISLQASCPL